MLHKGADHTTIAMHDQPARKPLSSSVNRVNGGQELLPRFRLIAKRAQHTARHHGSFTLVDASASHASMGTFDDDRDPLGPEHPLQGICDLRCDPLLNLKPLGIDLDEACQFGNPHHPVVRYIADMGSPDDRRHVVLAMGHETVRP
jgi:hypothetical protein